jgi:hypothetical protein
MEGFTTDPICKECAGMHEFLDHTDSLARCMPASVHSQQHHLTPLRVISGCRWGVVVMPMVVVPTITNEKHQWRLVIKHL